MNSESVTQFRHKNVRLAASYYRGQRAYFVTMCFDGRRRFGANARVATWLIRVLAEFAARFAFGIHAYCVMPDHMHILAFGAKDSSDLLAFAGSFKQATAAEFEKRTGRHLWQKKYYDHILRGRDSMDRVAWYIWMNPVRKGLCKAPAEYPFLGSFTGIGAKILASYKPIEWLPPWKNLSDAAAERGTER